jgi:hypothetical protein
MKQIGNRAEQFMSLVAKYNQGKRLNLVMNGSFQNRCTMATLQYNQGLDWQLHSWRKIIKRTPKKNLKRLISGRSKKIIYKRNRPPCRKLLFKNVSKKKKDNDYEIHSVEPEMDEEEMEKGCSRILTGMYLQVNNKRKVK